MKLSLALPIAAAALALSACSPIKPDEADLVILCTTDVHGACLSYDIKLNAPAKTSMANASTYIKEVREKNPSQVLLLDCGDFLQGQPSVYYYNFIDSTSEHLCARYYEYLKYDAIGVGNHDIETGESVYNGTFRHQLDIPWVCANAIDTRTGKPMFKPYVTFRRQGVKIVVFGLTTPHIPAWLPKTLWPHLEFDDMRECARQWMPIIQEQEHPDVVIGLFHAGVDYTIDGCDFDTPYNENGTVPAALDVPGFDLIIFGHDHTAKEFSKENCEGKNVYFMNSGTAMRKMGRANIHLTRQEDGSYKKDIETQMVDMRAYQPDPEYNNHFQDALDAVNEYVDRPIGNLTDSLSGFDGLVGPSAFIDLIHNVQLWASDAEVSLTAVLSPNDVVPAGQITMRHLFVLYKYENMLYSISMTADEIRRYLEHGYSMQYNTMRSEKDHLLNWLPTEEGTRPTLAGITFNYTSAAGMRYEVDVTKEPGHRVRMISMSDGTPIDPNRLYRVAINSYQYSGGGNFIRYGLGWDDDVLQSRTLFASNTDVRRCIMQYIMEHGTITPKIRGDWKVVPEAWYQKGRVRDLEILRPQGSTINHFH